MIRYFAFLFVGIVLSFSFAACDTAEPEPDPVEFPELRVVADSAYTVTASGLKYFDFVEGSGPAADSGNGVTVHYSGFFTDGSLFDSSLLPGRQPYRFLLGRDMAIDGFDEGIQGMKVGGQRQLYIPSDLAYGPEGSYDRFGNLIIPPNTPLIFDVEVIEL